MKEYEENNEEEKKTIFNNLLPKQIVGLLLKDSMSKSDLAEKIYGDRNVRSGISKWVNKLLDEDCIIRVSKAFDNSKSEFYKARLEVLGNFDKKEYEFIELCINRFWNPVSYTPFESLTDMIIEMLSIKKLSKLKNRINNYTLEKDLKIYKENKKTFWEDVKFRNEFLNKIHKKGDRITNKDTFSFHLKRDFIFVSMLVPETILNKLDLFKKSLGNPMYVTLMLLDEKNS